MSAESDVDNQEDEATDVEDSEESSSDEDVDYSSMTVAQLKEQLKAAGKPVSGKKSDLIERLNE